MSRHELQSLARRWWAGELGRAGAWLDVLLAPTEALYHAAVATRNRAFGAGLLRTHRVSVPIISVGNLAVGGSGKTPFAHWIARALRERGAHPAIVHGGYAPDEPALHQHWSPDIPVVVAADRVRAARTARSQGADVVVLDDGFQHRRLHRDLDIVLIAVEQWPALHRLLPRGPAREPLSALRRAHLLVTTRKTAADDQASAVRNTLEPFSASPIIAAHLEPAEWVRCGVRCDPPREALAVAALAQPELFAASARQAGATVRDMILLADHHPYSATDAENILRRAGGAPIVTTEKDWIKLRTLLPEDRLWRLVQRVRIDHGSDIIDAHLDAMLPARATNDHTR